MMYLPKTLPRFWAVVDALVSWPIAVGLILAPFHEKTHWDPIMANRPFGRALSTILVLLPYCFLCLLCLAYAVFSTLRVIASFRAQSQNKAARPIGQHR